MAATTGSSSSSSFSYFTAGLIVVTMFVTPVSLSHWFVDDSGLPMLTDGKYNLDKDNNIDPLHRHLCALLAAAELCLYFLMIMVSCYQRQETNTLVALVYGIYMAAAMIAMFTHPITGEAPQSMFDMPLPLLYVFIGIVFGGYIMDMKKQGQQEAEREMNNRKKN